MLNPIQKICHTLNSLIYSANNHMYSILLQAIPALKVYSEETITSYVIEVYIFFPLLTGSM